MRQHLLPALFLLIGLTVNAQEINLRGTVSNTTGKPIANAIVSLAKQGLKDTTGSDGTYSIAKSTDVVLPLLIPGKERIFLEQGVLAFSIPNPSPVKVEIFDVKGNLLQKESVPNAPTGFYRYNIAKISDLTKLLIIKASIGRNALTFRYLPLHNGTYLADHSTGSRASYGQNKLAVLAAISDTLKTTAAGYMAKSTVIASYDQALNITLDTAGKGARPSPGCGTATTLTKDKDTYVNVTAGSAGARKYIIRIPADYDENTPYALWFTPHCMNGTMAGVAAGSAGTGYAYYGMWKFANPAGGKGTTIFCSPEGINAQWGSGANDLTFFRYMINKFENELCIDMSRIFSEGFSMGGSMSYALACAMPDTMRAIAMHEGGSMSGCSANHGPVPMFVTIGTQELGMGTNQLRDQAELNGCDAMTIATNSTDQMRPVCSEYQGCDPGYPCRACVFSGGHVASPGTEGAWGEGNTWVDDSTWSFFKRFY